MLFHWGLILLQLCYLVKSQNFNPRPLNERNRNRQPPAVVLPRNFSPRSVQEAFARARANLNTRRTEIAGRRRPTLDIRQNIPVARHQQFQGITARSRRSEQNQAQFEEATRVLVDEFNLTPEQITVGLAETDLNNMLEGNEVQSCEDQFRFNCRAEDRYRTFDGTCNNLANPTWGMSAACFQRLVEPDYADGTSEPRRAVSGNPLPLPRRISLEIHEELNNPTDYVTHMFMVYGQFLDHDISLAPLSDGPDNQPLECCPESENNLPQCLPIVLGNNDPFFGPLNITCLSNVRSAMCSTCTLGPRQQTNQITAFIDASQIYGLSSNASTSLRNNDGTGTLRSQTNSQAGELPPPSANPDQDFCSFQNPNLDCFQTGDQRSNQHPSLTSMHTLFLRLHNRIARRLRELNSGWSDERIFQEARRIVGAILQVITYKEYLPLVIGPERMEWFDLNIQRSGYTYYDDSIIPSLANEFSAAAFRFGHSMINSFFPEISRGSPNTGNRLREIFQFPFGLYSGELEGLVNGLAQSPAQKFDRYMVRDITNHLYQSRGDRSGLDLASLNILRGRDHGVPGYTRLVEFCGGPAIVNWRQLDRLFQRGTRPLFQRIYEDVRDIDLFSGGLAERPNQGAVVGPTFTCIIGIQFYHLKYGDRFYFEHGGQAGSFTPAQLRELKKITLGKVICDNSGIDRIQPNVFLYPGNRNRVQNCADLPEIDLRVFS